MGRLARGSAFLRPLPVRPMVGELSKLPFRARSESVGRPRLLLRARRGLVHLGGAVPLKPKAAWSGYHLSLSFCSDGETCLTNWFYVNAKPSLLDRRREPGGQQSWFPAASLFLARSHHERCRLSLFEG